jgi:hypothetical protein
VDFDVCDIFVEDVGVCCLFLEVEDQQFTFGHVQDDHFPVSGHRELVQKTREGPHPEDLGLLVQVQQVVSVLEGLGADHGIAVGEGEVLYFGRLLAEAEEVTQEKTVLELFEVLGLKGEQLERFFLHTYLIMPARFIGFISFGII